LIKKGEKMRKLSINLTIVMLLILVFPGTSATDEPGGPEKLSARLKGFQEVPAISSTGSGHFTATISEDNTQIDFTLQWSNLEGNTVTQAHIHIGQFHVNGGISTFLCSSDFLPPPNPNPSPTSPTCPGPAAGEVKGTITASNIIGPADQGIEPLEFAEVLRAIRSGKTYANVHTDKFPAGEIRGQIRTADQADDDAEEDEAHQH